METETVEQPTEKSGLPIDTLIEDPKAEVTEGTPAIETSVVGDS